jgi:hypothetical protein
LPEDRLTAIETKLDEYTHKLDEHSKSLAKLEVNVEILKDNVRNRAAPANTRSIIGVSGPRV